MRHVRVCGIFKQSKIKSAMALLVWNALKVKFIDHIVSNNVSLDIGTYNTEEKTV